MRRPRLLAFLGATLSILGCEGTIGGSTWTPPDDEFRPGDVDFTCDESAEETPSVMRRLARSQLQHTVEDTIRRLLPAAEANALLTGIADDLAAIPQDLRAESHVQEGQKLFFRSDTTVGESAVSAHHRLSTAIGEALAQPATLDAMGASCATDADTANDAACVEELLERVGRLTHRRPMDDAERSFYRDEVYDAGDAIDLPALEDMFVVLFAQPSFLFHIEGTGPLTAYEAASRLSYHFWDTMPDEELFAAADSGELLTDEGWQAQVERVLGDDRARQSLQVFVEEWLRFDQLNPASSGSGADFAYIAGDLGLDGSFDDAVRAEPVDLLHHALRTGGTFRDFFLSDVTTTQDPRLAAIYGVEPAADGETVALPPERRSVLSRVGLLLARADVALPNINSITHPILRGVFIRRQITCDYLPAAPGGAMDDLPVVDRSVTGSREATEILTGATGCSGCHGRINPTGYALEGFDAIGQRRENEPLFDASGGVTAELEIDDSATIPESDGPVAGAPALAESLYESEKVGACFARHYLRFALARAEDPERDGCLLAELDEAIDDDRPLTEVLSAVVLAPSFRVRAAN